MSLVKFISGLSSNLSEKTYEDGAIYFVFPDGQHDNGHIYLDIKGSRHAISAAYDDSDIIDRLLELERVSLIHCTGISLSTTDLTIHGNTSVTLTATALPANKTDQIFWTNSNENAFEIVSTTTNNNVSTVVLSGIAEGNGVITAKCGNYTASCNVSVQTGQLVEHVLVSNYQCNGETFTYTAPISLDYGQYIEVSLSVAGITKTKENLISFGQDIAIGAGTGYRYHCYTSATASKIQNTLRMFWVDNGTNQSNIEVSTGNNTGDMVIKLDTAGIWINNTLYTPNSSVATMYNDILNNIRNFSSIEVGSAEGSNRSTAYYNYIKYYSYEES